MDSESSFTSSVSGGFVSKDRWETRLSYNNQIKVEQNILNKKYLEIKRDIKDAIYDFGEKL